LSRIDFRAATFGFRRFSSFVLLLCPLALPANAATVVVESVPSHASVFLDNLFAGMTPLTIEAVAAGPHLLQVCRHQYHDHVVVLTVDEEQESIRAALVPLGRGSLRIVTSPPDVDVFLNGSLKGKSPLTVGDLPAGKYQLRLEGEGLATFQEIVRVPPATETLVERALESKSETFLLAAISADPGRVVNYYDLAHLYMRHQRFDEGFAMFARGFDACVGPSLWTNEQRRLYDELERVWDGQYRFTDDASRRKLQPRITEELQKGIQRQPRNVANYWCLGSIFEKSKDWAAAVTVYEQALKALKAQRATIHFTHLVAKARYQQGLAAQQSNNFDEALSIYGSLVRDHCKGYHTRSALTQVASIYLSQKRDAATAVESKQQFIDLYPDSDQCPSVQMQIATWYRNQLKDYPKAIDAYRTYIRKYPDKDDCVQAQLSIASVYQQQLKDEASTIREYEKVLTDYPGSESVAVAVKALYDVYTARAKAGNDKAAEEKSAHMKQRLISEFPWRQETTLVDDDSEFKKRSQESRKAYSDAVTLARADAVKGIGAYRELIDRFPASYYAPIAQTQIINLYASSLKDDTKANQERERFAELFPRDDRAPSMLYQAGHNRCFVQKDLDGGVATLRKFMRAYPDHDLCVTAQYYIANAFSFSLGNYNRDRYIEENRKLIRDYPWYDNCDVAQTTIGLNYYYQFEPGDKAKAQRELLKTIQDYPFGSYAVQTEYYLDLIDAGMQLDENRIP